MFWMLCRSKISCHELVFNYPLTLYLSLPPHAAPSGTQAADKDLRPSLPRAGYIWFQVPSSLWSQLQRFLGLHLSSLDVVVQELEILSGGLMSSFL